MPRVLRIINRLNLGGPTFNAALLTKHLAPDFETLLVAGTKVDSEESSEYICDELGINYVRLPEMSREINLVNDRLAYKHIKKIISKFKPDIVHTHASKAGALGRLAAFSMKVPIVVHTFHGHIFHSYFNPVKARLFLEIEKYLAKKSSAVIAISEYQKDELVNKYQLCNAKKIRVIPLGFNLSRFHENMDEKRKSFRKKYFVEDDELVITIIGRLVPVKNHAMFLKALKMLLERTAKKVRAFIVGDGELLGSLQKLSDHLNIDHVYFPERDNKATLTFTSWMKDVENAVAGSDIVALTSYNEGTPVSLIEAQAAGKPIVSTNVGGIENVVIKNETALLCNSQDTEMFARHLLTLVENESQRRSISIKGWEHVGTKFHYSRLVKDTKGVYNELLERYLPK